MNFYRRHEPVILGAVLSLALVSFTLLLALLATRGLVLSDRVSIMRLFLNAVAFPGAVIALMVAIAQFRKSMAKPRLKIAFSEDEKTEAAIYISKDKDDKSSLNLWIINTGNAVTKLFQIDFEIPNIFDPGPNRLIGGRFLQNQIISPSSNGDASEETRILSFCNDVDFCVFVNCPVKFLTLSLQSILQRYEDYEEEYEIRYRVYGDWAETQEGKLKVICTKK